MNPIELHYPNGERSGVLVCGQCRRPWSTGNAEQTARLAEECCGPRRCNLCDQPITDKRDFSSRHAECDRQLRAQRHAEALDRAEKLEDWDGWVYLEGVGPREGYFMSLEDLVEYLHGSDREDWPEWVFVCKENPFPEVDPANIYERCCEELYEDAADDLCGTEEFAAAVKAFNAANAHLVTYLEDHTRAVRVPRPEPEEEAGPDVVLEGN